MTRALQHYWNLLFCRQPKLTATTCLTDGKGFAVSVRSAKKPATILLAITFFAVSWKSSDGKAFAISFVARADGTEQWQQQHKPSPVRGLTAGFAVSLTLADGKVYFWWAIRVRDAISTDMWVPSLPTAGAQLTSKPKTWVPSLPTAEAQLTAKPKT